ncbi:MAG TPA: anti-sigma factor [Gemmatimonadales bacterium]|nr:anti-sigma factor [Gemmatimonadales bacterium]
MRCRDLEQRIGALADGELVEAEARDVEEHLRSCPTCRAAHERVLALRTALEQHAPPLAAPDRLRAAVHARLETAGIVSRRPVAWRWLAAAAALVAVIGGTWQVATSVSAGRALADQVLASHVRSLMPGHLADVASTDQHTVKPWFNGRLDYSPMVSDFAGAGFPLIGGRLDYVGGRPVAALVYARRQHMIDVLLWPTGSGQSVGPAALTLQGYHMLHWVGPQYTYWVVSDLGTPELRQFVELLQTADSAYTP